MIFFFYYYFHFFSFFDRQVRLPRNQLFVTRVTGRTQLADLLHTVCNEKALDPRHYELRHPGIFAIPYTTYPCVCECVRVCVCVYICRGFVP